MYPTKSAAIHPDMVKKWMTCLGCGHKMWTDRCHRICKRCQRRHDEAPMPRRYRASLPRGFADEERRPSRILEN
jgi:hypothetical protein